MNLDIDLLDRGDGWTTDQAVALCKQIESLCPTFGYHVALTGGCLYKVGSRKDLDLVFYTVRQKEGDREGLQEVLADVGVQVTEEFGWMSKAYFRPEKFLSNRKMDLFFPETLKTGDDDYHRRDSENSKRDLDTILLD